MGLFEYRDELDRIITTLDCVNTIIADIIISRKTDISGVVEQSENPPLYFASFSQNNIILTSLSIVYELRNTTQTYPEVNTTNYIVVS